MPLGSSTRIVNDIIIKKEIDGMKYGEGYAHNLYYIFRDIGCTHKYTYIFSDMIIAYTH